MAVRTQQLSVSQRSAGLLAAALLGASGLAVSGIVSLLTVDAAPVQKAPVQKVLRPAVTSGAVSVTGSGFGHGVGMSQYGALGMARAGASASAILQHYYTGVSVAPYPDVVDVRVNVVHLGTSITLRSTALDPAAGGAAGAGGAWQIAPDAAFRSCSASATPSSSPRRPGR